MGLSDMASRIFANLAQIGRSRREEAKENGEEGRRSLWKEFRIRESRMQKIEPRTANVAGRARYGKRRSVPAFSGRATSKTAFPGGVSSRAKNWLPPASVYSL